MQPKPIRIAVIDDHRVFAEALAGRLSVEPDLAVVGTAGSSGEVLDLFSHHEIDVVTLDLDLGGEDGLAVGRWLRDRWPDLVIVVVTGAADDAHVCEAMAIGFRGWAGKRGAIEALLVAVRGAARGETHTYLQLCWLGSRSPRRSEVGRSCPRPMPSRSSRRESSTCCAG